MKFSISHNHRTWDASQDEAVIASVIEESLEADAAGFAGIFFPEHHFQGYSPTGADAFQMMAYLAPQLKQAWLGTAVCTLPNHHPTHLVEKMNMLDQLARGKVLFGLGSGLHVTESLGFGLDYEYQISRMMNDNLEVAERLWAKAPEDPPVTFETPMYKGTVLERIVPAPYRKARPRLMGVAMRDASIERAGKNGWPAWVSGMQGWDGLRKYRETLAGAGHPQEVVEYCMEWTSDVFQGIFIADTDEEAKADMLRTMDGHEKFNQRQWPYIRAAEEMLGLAGGAVRQRPPANDERYYNWACLWGSPDTVSRRIQAYADVGLGNLLLGFNNGLFDDDRRAVTRKTMDLFVREVMPRFVDIPTPKDPLAIDLHGKSASSLPILSLKDEITTRDDLARKIKTEAH